MTGLVFTGYYAAIFFIHAGSRQPKKHREHLKIICIRAGFSSRSD